MAKKAGTKIDVHAVGLAAAWVIILAALLRLAGGMNASAAVPTSQFSITSMSVLGTNLVLNATFPPGLTSIVLETQSELNGAWEDVAQSNVQTGATEIVFTIPKPPAPTAFFRLRGEQTSAAAPLISGELQYVAVPSLGFNCDTNGNAVFHFTGQVDGSDKIVITRQGALWEHVNWGWPQGPVSINDHQWPPMEKNYLTTTGPVPFLPDVFSLESVELEQIQGRDVVALERTDNALVVYLDDTPSGSDTYEFKIRFHPVPLLAETKAPSTVATLKIAAQIDGSDCIKFTATEATWEHKTYSFPSQISLNDMPWSLQLTNVLKNEGTNQFLPAGIDFSTAKIVSRKGRDLATMWSDKDAMWVRFADNPNGSDAYELEISFGQ
jgi:hypothetical protein